MLSGLLSSTYEITPGKLPAFVLAGQSNATGYTILEMARILNKCGLPWTYVWDSHPGNQIQQWYTATPHSNYNDLIAKIDALSSSYEIRAIFWIQGEWDALYGTTGTFQAYTENMFNAIISHLGYQPDINISKVWYAGSDSGIAANINTIRSLQDSIQSTYYISANRGGRTHDIKYYERFDDWHTDEPNYRMMAYNLLKEYAMYRMNLY